MRTLCTKRVHGFTLVEVLIATVVLSVGILAMVAIQGVYIRGSAAANNSAQASIIADTAIAHLEREGVMWSNYNPNLNSSEHPVLESLISNAGDWQPMFAGFPVNESAIAVGSAGLDANSTLRRSLNARYCVEARADWFENGQSLGGQVRVAWPINPTDPAQNWVRGPDQLPTSCTSASSLDDVLYPAAAPWNGGPSTEFSVVYMPFMIRRHNL